MVGEIESTKEKERRDRRKIGSGTNIPWNKVS